MIREMQNGMTYVQCYVQAEYGMTTREDLALMGTHRDINEFN